MHRVIRQSRSLAWALPFLFASAACSPERTTIRIALTTNETTPIVLDALNLASENGGTRSPNQTITTGKQFTVQSGKTETFVLLFDKQRTGPISIFVDGFLNGERVAKGEGAGSIVAGKNSDVTIVMTEADPLPVADLAATADAAPVDGGGSD